MGGEGLGMSCVFYKPPKPFLSQTAWSKGSSNLILHENTHEHTLMYHYIVCILFSLFRLALRWKTVCSWRYVRSACGLMIRHQKSVQLSFSYGLEWFLYDNCTCVSNHVIDPLDWTWWCHFPQKIICNSGIRPFSV